MHSIKLINMNKYTEEQLKFINYDGEDSVILSATAGSGKEQPLFSKILTPSGWTTMGEIKLNDEVLTPSGEVSKVVGVYPQGIKDVFKITFSDNSFTYAGREHLWKVKLDNSGSDEFKIVTTEMMMSDEPFGIKRNLWCIPLTDIYYPEIELPIEPYTLGRLLGSTTKIKNEGGVLPPEYLKSSKEQRLNLFKGLFETCGFIVDSSVFIKHKSKQLIYDIIDLVNSIGGVVDTDFSDIEYYSLTISLDFKLSGFNLLSTPRRAFKSIEYYDTVECQCIEIDHQDHLYVTDNYIVTHNTHSTVGRLNKMINDGVDPSRIIFFSFTNDAVNELKSRVNCDVKITTIHSFTSSLLGKMGLFKPIVTFYDFTNWYKEKFKPNPKDPLKIKMVYAKNVDRFYEEGAYISSTFSSYKLQNADNIKSPKPQFYDEYVTFIRETNSRDFSDMLIDTERLSRNPKYVKYFENLYDYIFIDEYQDTSTLQMKILLKIKAKQYHLIGDKFQSIYGFSGANCEEIETLLKTEKKVIELTLTKNFRSKKKIVENSNRYSDLVAIPNETEDGYIHQDLITQSVMYNMMQDGKPITLLARTNNVIKEIEKECFKKKIKMRYFNYITPQDLEKIRIGNVPPSLKKKVDVIVHYYGNVFNLINFIKENEDSDIFVTSIHKSKGREFPRCVIINSIDPELLDETYDIEEYTFLTESGEIDQEAKNIHYVAVTRPKDELYFLVYEN